MKKLIFLIMTVVTLMSCNKDEESNPMASYVAQKYLGSLGFVNNNGLNTSVSDVQFTVKSKGENVLISFHYGDDTGTVELLCTDIVVFGHKDDGYVGFKIKQQMAGEKIQHSFTGKPLGPLAAGLLPEHHGFFRTDRFGVVNLMLSADVHSYYGDDYVTGITATNNP